MDPFSDDLLTTLARQHGTPLWVYDAATISQRIAELRAFDTTQRMTGNTRRHTDSGNSEGLS